ncbi:MAG: heme lyase CcmF/NrfE family subunit [Rickettsiales bacterium]|nr:heme lyase CcmF/NrfE family subunit [Rickettsiales bacterium]
MIPTIGFTLLLAVFTIGLFLPFFTFFSLQEKSKIKISELKKISLILIILLFVSALLSQSCLIYSFIISDYSVSNVYYNSHHLKPLIYKISGSWGNHEGSMLLLITILTTYTLAFAFLSKCDDKKKLITIASQSFIISAFAAFTAFTSNPFKRIFPMPHEGLGLNPILQDIGLAMHPPMLYTGYIGFSLIFSFALASLLCEKINQDFARYLKNWLFFAYGFLTLGIGLGAWWAYRELGWGGYWFFDPVENISLMPWLAATALVHALKILEKKEIFKIWSSFLAILTFILCLLGIFLVRSGILTSVHSFAIDAKRGFFVIALITLIGGIAMLIFCYKLPKLKSEKSEFHLLSKIGAILVNNYFLILSLFIVLLGTLYPIFSQSFFNQFISIGPSYYNKLLTILIIPFLLFLAISYHLNYSNKTAKEKIINRQNTLICLISAAITSIGFYYEKDVRLSQITILFLAIFAAIITILFFSKVLKNNFSNAISQLPVTMAHLGFLLIIIGVILTSSFDKVKELNIRENESVSIANYDIKFSKIGYQIGPNFLAREGMFEVKKDGKPHVLLVPQLRFYPTSNQTTNEAAIKSGIFGDIYLVMGQKDENGFFALRIYIKPFIYLIWIGCAMIFSAMMVGILVSRALSMRRTKLDEVSKPRETE